MLLPHLPEDTMCTLSNFMHAASPDYLPVSVDTPRAAVAHCQVLWLHTTTGNTPATLQRVPS